MEVPGTRHRGRSKKTWMKNIDEDMRARVESERKMFMTVSDGEHSLKVNSTNLEK